MSSSPNGTKVLKPKAPTGTKSRKTPDLRCCSWSEALPQLDRKTQIELVLSLKSYVLWELSQLVIGDLESISSSGLLSELWMRQVQCEWE